MLEELGISVEFSHHEGGPGQNEIDLRYADALTMADNIMTFRTVVKEVAISEGVHATFMPKPIAGQPGSGMHVHLRSSRVIATRSTIRVRSTSFRRPVAACCLPVAPRARIHRGHQPVRELFTSASGAATRLPHT